jgi:hypothetical protein
MNRDEDSLDEGFDDSLAHSVQNLFASEAHEQPGDELRSMRMATRAAATFVKIENDSLRYATLQTFASEATPLQNDDVLAARLAAAAVASVLPPSAVASSRLRARSWLGMPLAVSVLLVSSGVLAASALVVVKVVVPAMVAARTRQPRAHALPKVPAPIVVAAPAVAVEPEPEAALAPPAEAPQEVVQRRPGPLSESVTAPGLFALANKQRRAGRVAAAVSLYNRLIGKFATAPEAGLARLSLADLALSSGNATKSLEHLNAFLKAAQTPSLIEEALQRKARVLVAAHRQAEARVTWSELRTRFPQSVYRLEADRYLEAKSSPIR